MAFDWITFFESIGVEYRTSGKNVKSGWVNVNCPLCGDDTGFHLGCSPESGGWSCWRARDHKGGGPTKLIKILKGCSWDEAKKIAGEDEVAVQPGSYQDLQRQMRGEAPVEIRPVNLFPEFLKVRSQGPTKFFHDYLIIKRKFDKEDIPAFCQYYSLRAATQGDWRGRLILPFLGADKNIYGWQGRAASPHAELRYLTYPDSTAAKLILFNEGPASEGGKILVITEGPVDAYKVDWYGKEEGIRAVATLGTSFLEQQVMRIWNLCPKFEKLVILFDPDAMGPALNLMAKLSSFDPILGVVPEGVEDPGAMTPAQVIPGILACL